MSRVRREPLEMYEVMLLMAMLSLLLFGAASMGKC